MDAKLIQKFIYTCFHFFFSLSLEFLVLFFFRQKEARRFWQKKTAPPPYLYSRFRRNRPKTGFKQKKKKNFFLPNLCVQCMCGTDSVYREKTLCLLSLRTFIIVKKMGKKGSQNVSNGALKCGFYFLFLFFFLKKKIHRFHSNGQRVCSRLSSPFCFTNQPLCSFISFVCSCNRPENRVLIRSDQPSV